MDPHSQDEYEEYSQDDEYESEQGEFLLHLMAERPLGPPAILQQHTLGPACVRRLWNAFSFMLSVRQQHISCCGRSGSSLIAPVRCCCCQCADECCCCPCSLHVARQSLCVLVLLTLIQRVCCCCC